MPTVDVYNLNRQKVGTADLDAEIFDVEVREHLFHAAVRAQLAYKRTGSAKVKERWEIRGSQRKMWKQKGTGRARQGSRKAPHWSGGGVVFGPRPRTFQVKVNKKTRRAALLAALSRRNQEGKLVVIDDMTLDAIRTKRMAGVVQAFESKSTLFCDVPNDKAHLSTRNLSSAHFVPVGQLNVYDVLRHETLLISKAAVDALQERMG